MARPAFPPARAVALALALALGTAPPAPADRHWEDDNHAYDRARRAVERGEALPATELLRRLRAAVPGEVIAMEYEFEFGCWVYEFIIIDPAGRIRKVHMDAATGAVIKIGDD